MRILFIISIILMKQLCCAVVTNTAASLSEFDVRQAISNSVPFRDSVVILPAGSNYYSAKITVTNAVTIIGSGTNQSGTILSGADCPFELAPESGLSNRLTNVRIEASVNGIKLVGINTDSRRVMFDNSVVTNCSSWAIDTRGALGVCSGLTIYGDHQVPFAYTFHANFDGGVYSAGSQSASNLYGTDQFMFFETCFLTNIIAGFHVTGLDSYGGGRFVVRYNNIGKASIEGHGLESGRSRGFRCTEIYNNNFRGSDNGNLITYMRSGTGLIHDNDVKGYLDTAGVLTLIYDSSSMGYPPWSIGNAERQGADGQNPWDVNEAGGPFATGTATAGGSQQVANSIFVTNTAATWSPNQWIGYAINRTSGLSITSLTRSGDTVTVDTSGDHGFTTGWRITIRGADQPQYNSIAAITVIDNNTFTYPLEFGHANPTTPATGTIYCFRGHGSCEIRGNTSSVVEYTVSAQTTDTDGNYYDLQFTNGTTFAIYHPIQGMDQPGRVRGSLIAGTDPPSRPGGWNDQETSPWYQWNNTRESGNLALTSVYTLIRAGEHYTNSTFSYTPYTYPHPMIAAMNALITGDGSGQTSTNGVRGKKLGRIKRL